MTAWQGSRAPVLQRAAKAWEAGERKRERPVEFPPVMQRSSPAGKSERSYRKKGEGSSSPPLQTIILTGILGATADAPAKKRRLPANSGLKSTRPRALGGWNVQHFLPRASANQRARLALPEDSTAARHSQSEESSPARLPRALLHRRDFAKRCADCARESGIPRVEIFNFFLSRELKSK